MSEKKKVRRAKLKDGNDGLRYTAWLIRQTEAGLIDLETAKVLNSELRTLKGYVETTILEELKGRLEKIEEAVSRDR